MSDTTRRFVTAATPVEALELHAASYTHPAGLYAAACYEDANAEAKGARPLAKWLCNHEQAKLRLTADLSGFSYYGRGPGDFEINGIRHQVADPKAGSVVESAGGAP
jgi:hypothetical protein